LVTAAEENAHLPADSISLYIRRVTGAHNRKNPHNKKKNVDLWTSFVTDYYEWIESAVKAGDKGKEEADESTVDNRGAGPVPKASSETKSSSNETRCCEVKVASILRQDLPSDMRDHILYTLNRLLPEATDYTTEYGIRLLSLFLILKNHAFDIKEESISLKPAQGFSVTDILPPGYNVEADTSTVPPPLSRKCLQSDYFNGYYKKMFDASHLQVIHAIYFGPVGSRTKDPIHTSFTATIPRDPNNLPKLDSYVMKIALQTYTTNYQNMWSKASRFRKLLNHLILVLLKIHLAPIREKKYKDYVKSKIDERQKKQESKEASVPDTAPVQAFSLINKSKNRRRNIFVRQKKEIQKLQGRLNTSNVQVDEYGDPMDVDEEASGDYYAVLEKITDGYERLDKYEKMLKREVILGVLYNKHVLIRFK
jgi:hypothetical protein